MRLEASSREGHYNLCDTSEVSIATHVAIYNDDNKKIKYINITTEDFVSSNLPEDVVYHIDEYLKYWFSSENNKIQEFRDFIMEHSLELELGSTEYKLKNLIEKREALDKRISGLTSAISMMKDELMQREILDSVGINQP